jgi:hypothetical protein
MGATGVRPLSVGGDQLRDEALAVEIEDEAGGTVPLTSPNVNPQDGRVKSRPWYRVVNLHSQWYEDYRQSHIEFENPDGETVRAPLQNSYQPEYGNRYYAKLMDLKRGVERQWTDFSIVMLTLSASTLNANGQPRCPADHMREIADGWKVARKQLYDVLDGRNWVYGRVWEPTSSDGHGPAGYGHMHVAVFVEDGDGVTAEDFRPFMKSYVSNTLPAGWKAHRPEGTPCNDHKTAETDCSDCKNPVSVTHDLEEANVATYISEYIGQYGEELTDRPIHERAFLAVAWATGTRRVEFSNDAQGIIRDEQFRRETGLRPSDRGDAEAGLQDADEDAEDGEGDWTLSCLCEVSGREPSYYDPTAGGVDMTEIDAADGLDPPRQMGGPA